MSTKTTIKRIALVAVAALTVGTVSAVSAQADGYSSFASISSTSSSTYYVGNAGFTKTFTFTGTNPLEGTETGTITLAGQATSCTAALTAAAGWSMTGPAANVYTVTREAAAGVALSGTVTVTCAAALAAGGGTATAASGASNPLATAASAVWTLVDGAAVTASLNNTKLVAWSGVGLAAGEPTAGGAFNHKTVNGVSGVFNTVRIKSYALAGNAARQINLVGGTIKNIYLGGGCGPADEVTPLTGVNLGGYGLTVGASSLRVDANNICDFIIEINTPVTAVMTASLFTEYAPGIWNALATESVNVIVDSALSSSVYSYSTVTRTPADAADLGTSAVAGTTAGTINVVQKDAAGNALLQPFTKAVTVTVSGVGTLNGAGAAYLAVPAGSANSQTFTVLADGRAGTASVAIAVNGVVVSTKTFVFYGSLAKYTVAVDHNYVLAASSAVRVATVTPVDALGNVVVNASAPVVTSSDALIARNPLATYDATAADGSYAITVDTVNRGAFTLTIANAAVSPTITATAASRATGVVDYAKGVSWTLDESSYEVGSKITLTFTLKDSDGNPGADATHPLFSVAPTANLALAGFAIPAGITTVDGKKVYTFYAPGTAGDLVIAGKLADTAATAVSLTATVVNSVMSAAADSAAEATDAANAATDAANAAAEAADAATAAAQDAQAAVAELATKVASLIAGIKAQITTLANLVLKIKKKVRA